MHNKKNRIVGKTVKQEASEIKITNLSKSDGSINVGDYVRIIATKMDDNTYCRSVYEGVVDDELLDDLVKKGVVEESDEEKEEREKKRKPSAYNTLKEIFGILSKAFPKNNSNPKDFENFFVNLYVHSKHAAISLVLKTYANMIEPLAYLDPNKGYYIINPNGVEVWKGSSIKDPSLLAVFSNPEEAIIAFNIYKILDEKRFMSIFNNNFETTARESQLNGTK